MRSVVLYCPHLKRDISGLRAAVPDLIVHEGRETHPAHIGGLESHLAIVGDAKSIGASRVFLMEDDCMFTSHFNLARWIADADWAQAAGYDVMAGGCTRTYDQRLVRDDGDGRGMVEVSAFHSSHCMVYFESGYSKVLQAAANPIDWSLGRDCAMRCVVTIPFVAVQRPCYSGMELCEVDYTHYYQRHEDELMGLLGSATGTLR